MKKFIFIFAISFSLFAGIKEDLEGIGVIFPKGNIGEAQSDIIYHMKECGYAETNQKRFIKKLILENDQVKTNCIVSKQPGYLAGVQKVNDKKDRYQQARLRIDALDCSTLLKDFEKDTCYILQGR